jgi:predicted nucleic acid-binding protein
VIRFPLPEHIALDTSVIIAAAYSDVEHSAEANELLNSVREEGVAVYFSSLLRVEFGRVVRRLATNPTSLSEATRDSFALSEWSTHPLIRQRWLANGVRRFDLLVSGLPKVVEVPATTAIWRESVNIMGTESLDAIDAIQMATTKAVGVFYFFTLDSDIRRVQAPRIHLIS